MGGVEIAIIVVVIILVIAISAGIYYYMTRPAIATAPAAVPPIPTPTPTTTTTNTNVITPPVTTTNTNVITPPVTTTNTNVITPPVTTTNTNVITPPPTTTKTYQTSVVSPASQLTCEYSGIEPTAAEYWLCLAKKMQNPSTTDPYFIKFSGSRPNKTVIVTPMGSSTKWINAPADSPTTFTCRNYYQGLRDNNLLNTFGIQYDPTFIKCGGQPSEMVLNL